MKVAIIYVHPTTLARTYQPLARRFVGSYMEAPPGQSDHELYVAINGGIAIGQWCSDLFSPLAPRFFAHNNYGKDIGAYQAAADLIDCDLLVCLGSHCHFHRAGWLDRMIGAYIENGPALYGCWGFLHPSAHIRTTAFWLPPWLLLAYPRQVGSNPERYGFEHGPESITLWSQQQGFEPLMVTWKGTYTMKSWEPINWRESLVIDQHIDRSR
jgi:hypothetical protein